MSFENHIRQQKSGKVKYRPEWLRAVKPKAWKAHPRDKNVHKETGEAYSVWKQRMDVWEQCSREAQEPDEA